MREGEWGIASSMHGGVMALLTFGVEDCRPLLVSPWEVLCLCGGVVFVESGECGGLFDFGLGFGMVKCGDGGGGGGGLVG